MGDCFSTSIVDRVVNTATLPLKITHTGFRLISDVLVGITATAMSVLTGGMVPKINEYADLSRFSSNLINETLYKPLMEVINPNFICYEFSRFGVVTEKIAHPIFKAALDFSESENIFMKHAVSRIAYLTFALVATATRTVDFTLGIFAALASIVTLGAVPKINTFAMRHLAATGLINDLCVGIRGFVNPHQWNVKL